MIDREVFRFLPLAPTLALLGYQVAPGARADRCRFCHHGEKHASADATVRDGWILWVCRSCGGDVGGDLFSLAGDAWGMDARRQFREVATRLGDVLGVTAEAASARTAPPRPRRDPAISVALTLDAMADDWIAGRGFRDHDVAAIEAAGFEAGCEALAVLADDDTAQRARQEAIDAELDRLAAAHERQHVGCECQGGTRPHTGAE